MKQRKRQAFEIFVRIFLSSCAWIEEGENVAITMRRKIVARLIPERAPTTPNAPTPEFDSISKSIFRAKTFRGNLANREREGYES